MAISSAVVVVLAFSFVLGDWSPSSSEPPPTKATVELTPMQVDFTGSGGNLVTFDPSFSSCSTCTDSLATGETLYVAVGVSMSAMPPSMNCALDQSVEIIQMESDEPSVFSLSDFGTSIGSDNNGSLPSHLPVCGSSPPSVAWATTVGCTLTITSQQSTSVPLKLSVTVAAI